MMNEEEMANVATIVEDLHLDLRNGNVPAAKLLIVSLGNCLTSKEPLEWHRLGNFCIENLDDAGFRIAALHFLTIIKDKISPSQPDQEASAE